MYMYSSQEFMGVLFKQVALTTQVPSTGERRLAALAYVAVLTIKLHIRNAFPLRRKTSTCSVLLTR